MNSTPTTQDNTPLPLKTRWLIVLAALFLLAIVISSCVTLLYFGAWNAIHEHPAVKPVLERIKNEPRITDALGTPLEFGILGDDARVSINKTDGFARYTLPVKGPKGEGMATVHATMETVKIENIWTFKEMSFLIKGHPNQIDLLEDDRPKIAKPPQP